MGRRSIVLKPYHRKSKVLKPYGQHPLMGYQTWSHPGADPPGERELVTVTPRVMMINTLVVIVDVPGPGLEMEYANLHENCTFQSYFVLLTKSKRAGDLLQL